MPGYQVGVYAGQEDAGTEVSSTYEGRHVTVREDELIHTYIADGLVNKGDPVVLCKNAVPGTYGHAVGVAFRSGLSTSDLIAIDTEGIWNLKVDAYDDDGGSVIEIGDPLFIRAGGLSGSVTVTGVGDAEISKRRNLVTQVPFGYALGRMESTSSGRIAVKIHWDPEEQQDEFAIFQDAHGADNMKSFTLLDEDDNASGMTHVVNISGQYTGAKTGSAVFTGLNIDIDPDNDCPYVYGVEVYTSVIADKTIGFLCAYSAYFEDYGDAVGALCMIDLGKASVHAPVGRNAFIRCREHGAAVLADATFLLLEGANAVGYLVNFNDVAGAENGGFVLEPHSDTETSDYRIRVRLGQIASDRYIYLYPV